MSDDFSGMNLYDLFREEVESQAAQLVDGLLSIERTGRSGAAIEPLMRAAHSIKGAGRVVQAEPIVQTSHALEDVLVAAQKGKFEIQPAHVDVFLRAVDVIVQIARLPEEEVAEWTTAHEAETAALVAELSVIALTPPTPPAPAPVAPPAQPAPEASAPVDAAQAESVEAAETSTAVVKSPAASSASAAATPQTTPATSAPAPSDISADLIEPPAIEVKAKVPRDLPDDEPAPQEPNDRVVRVAAQSLTRLVTLAGASVVEAQRLAPLTAAFDHVRREQIALLELLQTFESSPTFTEKLSRREQDQLIRAKTIATDGLAALSTHLENLDSQTRRHEDLSVRLHREVLASRMRPISDGLQGFPRLVRDLSRRLGKEVTFEVRGESTGVDRDLLELLDAPLNHLVRNSLDHGLEMPEERRQAGKNPVGRIRIEAGHRAGWLQIIVADDGRGIDAEKVRRRIVERGLTTAEVAARLTPAEVYDFLFLPGFTTTSAVTELSGRGVGLDVVLSRIRAVGGTVRIASQLGRGAAFHLQLPITTSVVRALLVQIAGEPYACPLARLERIARAPRSEIETLEGRPWWKLDGEAIGLADAAQVLELEGASARGDDLPIVVVGEHGRRYGIVVEEFLGERDLVVHPLDPRLGKVPNVNSASILEDGWPVLLIDVEDLVQSIDHLFHGRRLKGLTKTQTASKRSPRVLVVDDSITVRELERQLLQSRGYTVDVAVDGIDGWNAVRERDYRLVVSDVDMPRMNGIELVRKMKADARLRDVPVVIVSYKDREEDRLRGLEAGAQAYLTKSSFHDQSFLRTIADLLGDG